LRPSAGSHPLCHGQKQLLDRPSCWRNFCYQPNLYQAAIAGVYVCGVGPGSSVCPGSTAPTTHRPKCSFGALRRSRRLSCTSRRLCCERADICLYPICTKPRCAGVCLRGRTEGGPLRRYQSDSPNDMARRRDVQDNRRLRLSAPNEHLGRDVSLGRSNRGIRTNPVQRRKHTPPFPAALLMLRGVELWCVRIGRV
jgi:hypothetical protein